ncbi:IclR family transcriptional regulator [Microbacterium testaceum]|uniref:Glycerol operon regulatory protein n=1 Tax=Microbacterium testaceum TaxID=2033 RepID=A0A147F0G2_MICTE|nr:IclR family transcriptional regulator C-terminal domain-containing protein [Microbacterium testaceum]KTR96314.1 IclR family transcriptional regulator [Microbacterium testaceum]
MSEAVESESGSGDFVQSLARGLEVIRAFDAEHPALTLSDVARRAGLTRAAARRFLRTLETLGYVRADGRAFSLTPRILELGFSYLSALSLPALAQPHLERLSRQVDESVSSAVLDGADIVYVARVPTRRIMSVGITIGTRFPAYATSMGRVLLAALPEDRAREIIAASRPEPLTSRTRTDVEAILAELGAVRTQGWSFVDGELEEGLRSLAAPLHDREGTVVAAVNISATARGDANSWRAQCLSDLLAAAADIDGDLRLV